LAVYVIFCIIVTLLNLRDFEFLIGGYFHGFEGYKLITGGGGGFHSSVTSINMVISSVLVKADEN
jgi:hypothetical protein